MKWVLQIIFPYAFITLATLVMFHYILTFIWRYYALELRARDYIAGINVYFN